MELFDNFAMLSLSYYYRIAIYLKLPINCAAVLSKYEYIHTPNRENSLLGFNF